MFQLVSAAGNQNQGSSNNFLCASILHGLPWNNNFVPNVSKPNLYVGCHVCSHCPDQLTSGLLCSVDTASDTCQTSTWFNQASTTIQTMLAAIRVSPLHLDIRMHNCWSTAFPQFCWERPDLTSGHPCLGLIELLLVNWQFALCFDSL